MNILKRVYHTHRYGAGFPRQRSATQHSGQLRTHVRVVFNVSANAFIDKVSELGVVKRGTILFDQTVEFIEDEVFGVDLVVESGQDGCCSLGSFEKGILFSGRGHTAVQVRLHRISDLSGSMPAIITCTELPGSAVPGSGSLPRR